MTHTKLCTFNCPQPTANYNGGSGVEERGHLAVFKHLRYAAVMRPRIARKNFFDVCIHETYDVVY